MRCLRASLRPSFLSTLSLRRATHVLFNVFRGFAISIHALLAESDLNQSRTSGLKFLFLSTLSLRRATVPACCSSRWRNYFYPRSPCGERLAHHHLFRRQSAISIHALLAESDANLCARISPGNNFYPRSPCGERLHIGRGCVMIHRISIHALLAESDDAPRAFLSALAYFYPRSPCGERHELVTPHGVIVFISIHALLAESDRFCRTVVGTTVQISIHALLAESDRAPIPLLPFRWYFYPRSPCGERLAYFQPHALSVLFLSTLSLRRATEQSSGTVRG